MAAISVKALPGAGVPFSGDTNNAIAVQALDNVGGDTVNHGSSTFLLLTNDDAGQQTVDITGTAASDNAEAATITVTLDPGEVTIIGPFKPRNYARPLAIQASVPDVKGAALKPAKGG